MMLTAIGLMSGTSLDGVDVALIETDGRKVRAFGPSGYRPYSEMERRLLRQALFEAINLPQRDARPGILREAEQVVTIAHAEAVAAFTAQNRITAQDIDIVGFHGQTVLHRPERRLTVQIGDGAALAKAIRCWATKAATASAWADVTIRSASRRQPGRASRCGRSTASYSAWRSRRRSTSV